MGEKRPRDNTLPAAFPGPEAAGFRVRQHVGRLTSSQLAKLDHLLVLTPPASGSGLKALAAALPALKPLTAVAARLGRRGDGLVLRGRLPGTGSGLSWARLPKPQEGEADVPPAFFLQKLAGELAADGLAEHPRSLGIVVTGGVPERERVLRAVLLAVAARAFQGPEWRKEGSPSLLKQVHLLGLDATLDVDRTLIEAEQANLVRWLTALPANKLTLTAYREGLATLARRHGWTYEFLDEAALKKRGAGAFLAVAQGNATRDAGIAHLRYRPHGQGNDHPEGRTRGRTRGARPSIALVGKGILFDTGGNNLKTAKGMLDMHMDMSGSAVALATLGALTRLRCPVPVDCWLALTENRIGPTAYRQRDVVTASNGTTIEVVHTDAEGRMALADTLALAGETKPALIIDYATLTGACVYALSERYSGVFTNREALDPLLVAAGRDSGERVWPFPMDADFDEDLKSKVADVAQCSMAGEGDHILAARFLKRFVPKDSAWIHVDLSAVMRKEGLAHVPGPYTGFGVRLTLSLLLDHAGPLEAVTGPLGLKR